MKKSELKRKEEEKIIINNLYAMNDGGGKRCDFNEFEEIKHGELTEDHDYRKCNHCGCKFHNMLLLKVDKNHYCLICFKKISDLKKYKECF